MHPLPELFPDDVAPLPPPPAGPRRLARGSWPPIDLMTVMSVREIAAPEGWSRVVPVSVHTGEPLLRRDRRPRAPGLLDRTATAVVGGLAVLAGALVTLLLL